MTDCGCDKARKDLEEYLRNEVCNTEHTEIDQSPMVLQDRPLETQNITESSANTCESCLSCCPRAEIQEKRGIEPLCTTENELGKNSCQSEPQQQSMGSSEEVSSERYSEEDTTAHTVTQGATFETVTDFLDFCDELQQTDVNNEVVLNIVEDTDLEEKSAPAGLLINKVSYSIPLHLVKMAAHSQHLQYIRNINPL